LMAGSLVTATMRVNGTLLHFWWGVCSGTNAMVPTGAIAFIFKVLQGRLVQKQREPYFIYNFRDGFDRHVRIEVRLT
jgi:hypothetical protein